MDRNKLRIIRRDRRKRGIRKRVIGGPDRPRLTVFRSGRHLYAQVVDDLAGRTIVSASTIEKGHRLEQGGNRQAATEVGTRLAERARAQGIERIVFDRNGYRFHGRVKALADAVREGGLSF
ncbi:MAG: 50S ribosomal protein L18 [Planctomycetota bacterium]|jgi:large subunit ribosomal protein L18